MENESNLTLPLSPEEMKRIEDTYGVGASMVGELIQAAEKEADDDAAALATVIVQEDDNGAVREVGINVNDGKVGVMMTVEQAELLVGRLQRAITRCKSLLSSK